MIKRFFMLLLCVILLFNLVYTIERIYYNDFNLPSIIMELFK